MLALLLAGCAHREETPILTPHAWLDDRGSEELHDHCEVRAVRALSPEDIDRTAAADGATFVEIVYEPRPSQVGVVLYRCPAGVAERAQRM